MKHTEGCATIHRAHRRDSGARLGPGSGSESESGSGSGVTWGRIQGKVRVTESVRGRVCLHIWHLTTLVRAKQAERRSTRAARRSQRAAGQHVARVRPEQELWRAQRVQRMQRLVPRRHVSEG